MSEMDRRAFVGAAAVGGVAAAVLAASSAMAAGQSGYFVIAEIVSKKDKADELRALLVPFAELSAKEPGCLVYTLMEVIGEPGRHLRTLDRQGRARGSHDHAAHQGNRAETRTRSGEAVHAIVPRRAHGRVTHPPGTWQSTAHSREPRNKPEPTGKICIIAETRGPASGR